MSVFDHEYRPYEGRLTALGSRPLVLARYAMNEAWSSKISVGLFVLGLLPCLVNLVIIYVADNPIARALILRGGGGNTPFSIGESFFLQVLETQCWFALVLAAWIAPRLVSFDLSDNALPILLSHPISRFGYLLGKFIALAVFLSYVTWIPCLTLFVYQCYASPVPWGMDHLRLGAGLFIGAAIWILLLSMVGLAVSSWVKWRVIATGAMFAVVFVPAGVGGIASAILRTKWGLLLNIPVVMSELWQRLLGAPSFMNSRLDLPTFAIVSVLIAACMLCVAVLNARIRAREVVRG
ncbi:ABC transporter permease subunit [Telmatobacter sp. DSM 110680]|uniref:ABC transporter permease subunit n=1 Tax=Telmatobacter sp. DSM 110680 TaxID=3036704 RepID=A0AAU7DQM1_9BACT